ncbi:hypothetical protein Scep_004638 [Stephania cephalantha]|uniref:Transposase-associated domain-containing protein n=1 Tax=Stephania cephalantha TaxID=152367 RepID=A0AAP0PXG9_9MAGN
MSSTNRDWMYNRLDNGYVRIEFAAKVKEFISFAKQHCPTYQSERKIRCPCNFKKCRLVPYLDVETVEHHLCRYGFVRGYHSWYEHGENGDEGPQNSHEMDCHIDDADVGGYDPTPYREMLHNVAGPSFNWNAVEESPNPQARQLYDMIDASREQLWPGCETMTTLSAMARLLAIKSEHHIFERGYNEIIKLMKDCLPNDNSMVENFYATKRLMRGLGLPVEKIDCCEDQCMIYWGVDSELTSCKFCGKSRYVAHRRGRGRNTKNRPCKRMYYFPLGPRLQRLYASESTAKHMRWHGDHSSPEDVMQHCSDSIAWRHFNDVNKDFAAEVRNVRLGLCIDGFLVFGLSGKSYSSWPVILTPYNLPPSMCMKFEFMFLTVIVPGPTSPKRENRRVPSPLVKELQDLWNNGVVTYDVSTKTNFVMRVALLWTR